MKFKTLKTLKFGQKKFEKKLIKFFSAKVANLIMNFSFKNLRLAALQIKFPMPRVVIVLSLLLWCTPSFGAERVGLALVGLGGFSFSAVDTTASILATASTQGDVEVSALAYSFVPEQFTNDMFTNWTRLVQKCLPAMKKNKLFITTYLDDGANRHLHTLNPNTNFPPFWQPSLYDSTFWAAFMPGQRTGASLKAYTAIVTHWATKMVFPYYEWVSNTVAWAKREGLQDKIVFILVPVLEDHADTSLSSYTNLFYITKSLLSDLPVAFRRNPADPYSSYWRFDNIPLERHTNDRNVIENELKQKILKSGDVVDNDGCYVTVPGESETGNSICDPIFITVFETNQEYYVSNGLFSLLWHPDFNQNTSPANQYLLSPSLRQPLTPFTDKPVIQSSVVQALNSR